VVVAVRPKADTVRYKTMLDREVDHLDQEQIREGA
jgi:hypothetical protein